MKMSIERLTFSRPLGIVKAEENTNFVLILFFFYKKSRKYSRRSTRQGISRHSGRVSNHTGSKGGDGFNETNGVLGLFVYV